MHPVLVFLLVVVVVGAPLAVAEIGLRIRYYFQSYFLVAVAAALRVDCFQ